MPDHARALRVRAGWPSSFDTASNSSVSSARLRPPPASAASLDSIGAMGVVVVATCTLNQVGFLLRRPGQRSHHLDCISLSFSTEASACRPGCRLCPVFFFSLFVGFLSGGVCLPMHLPWQLPRSPARCRSTPTAAPSCGTPALHCWHDRDADAGLAAPCLPSSPSRRGVGWCAPSRVPSPSSPRYL